MSLESGHPSHDPRAFLDAFRRSHMHPQDAHAVRTVFEGLATSARAVVEQPEDEYFRSRLEACVMAFRMVFGAERADHVMDRMGIDPEAGAIIDPMLWRSEGQEPFPVVRAALRGTRERLTWLEGYGANPAMDN
jgi:hypothetical protein